MRKITLYCTGSQLDSLRGSLHHATSIKKRGRRSHNPKQRASEDLSYQIELNICWGQGFGATKTLEPHDQAAQVHSEMCHLQPFIIKGPCYSLTRAFTKPFCNDPAVEGFQRKEDLAIFLFHLSSTKVSPINRNIGLIRCQHRPFAQTNVVAGFYLFEKGPNHK